MAQLTKGQKELIKAAKRRQRAGYRDDDCVTIHLPSAKVLFWLAVGSGVCMLISWAVH